MQQVYFATTNKGKINSVSSSLKRYDIEVVQVHLDIPEPRSDDLQEIAKEKVLFAYDHIKKPAIAQDAGFYIHSCNGFPGAFVNLALNTIGIPGLLKLVDGEPRGCEFRNCLAYLDSSLKEPVYFESSVKGTLSEQPRGEKGEHFWSDLSFIFVPEGETKTLAEMGMDEYQEWREVRLRDSFSSKFAEWFSMRK
ncbi:MAG: hypothetical protein ISS93_01105 [Candidatus Aenigmarchaeota archaeon]|nr:hypothetical protein [Candidatus Aenigmarchaeota archaeon]